MDINSKHLPKENKLVQKINKKMVGDSIGVQSQKSHTIQLSELQNVIEKNHHKNTQTLLLDGQRTDFFVTEDSRKYISLKQQYKKDNRYDYIDSRGYFDSVHVRYIKTYSASELQYNGIVSEFRNARDIATSFKEALKLDLSPIRMWQVSIAGAVLFGMISMSMIYNNLGQSAFASESDKVIESGEKIEIITEENVDEIKIEEKIVNVDEKAQEDTEEKIPDVVEVETNIEKQETVDEVKIEEETKEVISVDSVQKSETKEIVEKDIKSIDSVVEKDADIISEVKEYSLEDSAYEMVEGFPIEKMLPHILKQDPEVAKYLIAMAKQESAWGERVPVLNGQDCYNYWGFRSQRKLMGSGGHTCFNSRQDAVETVGRRIHELIYEYDRTTAERLIVWKCGSSCDGHSQEGVDRWIRVVDTYYSKLSKK